MRKSGLVIAVLSLLLMLALVGLSACGSQETEATTASESSTDSSAVTQTTIGTSTSASSDTATTVGSGASAANTLVIGQITSLSGPMSASFKNEADAAKPVEDFLNARGGVTINGEQYKIDIVTEDDMSTQEGAIAAGQKLVGQGIKFMITPHFLPNILAVNPILEAAKVLRVVPDAISSQPAAPPNKYCFMIRQTAYGLQPTHDKIVALYPNVKKVGIIAPDDPGIRPLTDTIQKDLEGRLGLQVVFREDYPVDTQDFSSIVTKALAAKPDALSLTTGIPQWGKGIIEAARQMGFTGPIFASAPMGDVGQLNSLLDPKAATDFVEECPWVNSPDMPQLTKDFAPVIKAAGLEYNLDHFNILNSVNVLLQGIAKAQSLDVNAVAAALESMDSVETTSGPGAKFVGAQTLGGIDGIGQNRMLLDTRVPISRIMNGQISMEWVPAVTK